MDAETKKLLEMFEDTRHYFVAFGDKYRQEIIVILGKNNHMTVKQLAKELGLSRPATSHHIKILKEAGMLGEKKEGVRRYYYPTLKDVLKKVKVLVDAAEPRIEQEEKK